MACVSTHFILPLAPSPQPCSVDAQNFEVTKDTMASVTSDGEVTWLTPVFLTGTCEVDVTYFPFDTQHCHLNFTSWSYPMDQLDLRAARGPDSAQN